MKTLDELKAMWNAKADRFNRWHDIGMDEIVEFAQAVERAECSKEIESLIAERDMLRTGDTCARQCEGTAYRIELQRLRREMPNLVIDTTPGA